MFSISKDLWSLTVHFSDGMISLSWNVSGLRFRWSTRVRAQRLICSVGDPLFCGVFQEDEKFLTEVFAQLTDEATEDDKRRELVLHSPAPRALYPSHTAAFHAFASCIRRSTSSRSFVLSHKHCSRRTETLSSKRWRIWGFYLPWK